MGHHRLGRLPRRQKWREVIDLLDRSPLDAPGVADATLRAAQWRLGRLANDLTLAYSFWLLTRVAWASRGEFASELADLGIVLGDDASAFDLVGQMADHARRTSEEQGDLSHFSEIALLALRQAITETVAQQGRSLFGSQAEDVRQAFRAYSTRERFGDLAHRFFGSFLSRALRSIVDRELANHVGAGGIGSIAESREFLEALDVHARQSARVVQEFAGAWYAKHNWESQGRISLEEARRFVAHAVRKLRSELQAGAA